MSKPLYLKLDYIDRKIEQSMRWVNGHPEHDKIYDECCADFSCCNPELFENDVEKRIASHTRFIEQLLERRKGVLNE